MVKYSFPDYPNEWESTIYCDFELNEKLSVSDLKERIETEIIGEEIDGLEIVDCISNTFCDDNLLSLTAVGILNGGFDRVDKNVFKDKDIQALSKADKELFLCYLSFVYRNLNAEEQKEYKEKLRERYTCLP